MLNNPIKFKYTQENLSAFTDIVIAGLHDSGLQN